MSQTLLISMLLCVGALALSLLLTRGLIALLPKLGMVDKPDFKRHIHTTPTPRGGGIAIAITFLGVTAAFFGIRPHAHEVLVSLRNLLLPLGILIPLGILDDRFGLRARTKFLFQILTAALAWYLGARMTGVFGIPFPPWLSCIATIFWIVALINAFNMIDGVDGLAGGIACISAFCMGFIALTRDFSSVVFLLAVLEGAILGFLVYNWHPARIFMGDTGSMFLGYLLAVMGLNLNARILSIASIGVPLLACGVPFLDIFLAVWRRVFNPDALKNSHLALEEELPDGEEPVDDDAPLSDYHKPYYQQNFFQRVHLLLARLGAADRRHIHHRLLQYFQNNQQRTVRRIYSLAAIMGVMAIACAFLPGRNSLLAILIILGTFSFIISRLATIELWNSAETLYQNFHTARTGVLLSHVLNPIYDIAVITLTAYLAMRHTQLDSPGYLLRHVAVVMAVMMLSRNYRTFWNYAVSDDYFRLLVTLALGYYLSWCLAALVFPVAPGERYLATAGVVFAAIIGQRLFLHFLRNYIVSRRVKNAIRDDKSPVVSTLIFGVSPLARFYRDYILSDIERAGQERLVGILVRQRRFRHSFVYGLRVLGVMEDLDRLYEKYHFQKIVATITPDPEELSRLREFCEDHDIPLIHFTAQENKL